MGSIVADKRALENGDCSLLVSPPRYTRRKVSAIRDFPGGCGPNAAGISPQLKEVGSIGKKECGALINVDFSREKGSDVCAVMEKLLPEEKVESQSHDAPSCSNGNEQKKPKLNKCDEVEQENEENLKLPEDNPKSFEVLSNIDEDSKSENEIRDTLNELIEPIVESPSARKDTGNLDLAVDDIALDKGASVQHCSLPHYPVPPNLVWKEPKYPPRRKVSAVRDFPVGCGHIVPKLCDTKDQHIDQREPDSKMEKAIVLYNANLVGVEHEADNVVKDKEQGLATVKGGDTLVLNCDSDRTPLFRKSYDTRGQEEISEDKNGEKIEKEIELSEFYGKCEGDTRNLPDGLDKEIMVYVKDKNKKKKSIGAPCKIVGAGSGSELVIVQGLMAADHCPWRVGKGAVKSTPTVAKRKKGKCDFSSQGTRKGSPNENKLDSKVLAGRGMMVIPYHEEGIDEISRPLDVINDSDSSENDELDDYQLLPRDDVDVYLTPRVSSSSSERGMRAKVRDTLRLFQIVHRRYLQAEETKSKDQDNASKRADIRAAKTLKEAGRYLNTVKGIGPVPGVEVGDIFNYRIELAIIGLHTPLQGGIDIIKVNKQPIAISIVASGGYANDVDNPHVLIYTGQGGNATGGDKQPEDQKLERGNLGLKNCIDKKTLVRVIRGFKETKAVESSDGRPNNGRSKTIATYTYDGLYTVEKYWHDLGSHGKLVFKFELRRVPGQPELAWKEMKQSKKFKEREGRCIADISDGKEDVPIGAVNTIDDEKPPPFTYITSMMYPDWCRPIPPKGCDCKNGCSDSEHCACAFKNGGDIPYNYSGAIVQAKSLVYECGPLCKCPPSCHNRVSQHGIKLPLEIFKTNSRGWGVRCLSAIPSGSFICEYIGELLDDKEADQRTSNDEYLFDIGQNYNDSTLWEGLSDLLPDKPSISVDVIENVGFTIDAVSYGNVGRFINHSCTPNLYAQNVLYDHEDKRIPHIMLFAAENIPPLQELAYHYNYIIDQVLDSKGNIKKKSCYCGSMECSGRMY
ncbi:histone-lysine N-methyltransferase, H3 lysine-9 specific SUVH6-like [Chenopodium quinoa]|uniref:histone-lysine N-methyltransferase, H3 lysine-9 specific SUVH6-like n=1 Tax=Chenopodium quinoa TaxID=63459 RepID=UPI000B7809E9|nr:histone-lysine N-methyltransferase, H3 lysine-9 specific SUVH6-like [Chenopodium quinoa]